MITALHPNRVTVLMGGDAALEGTLSEWGSKDGRHGAGRFWVKVHDASRDKLTWTVDVPESADYEVTLFGSGVQTQVEIVAGPECLVAWVDNGLDRMNDGKWASERLPDDEYFNLRGSGWHRMPVGSLRLAAGRQQITLRARRLGPSFALYALELITPAAAREQTARAARIASPAGWLADRSYGLQFHWTSRSMPRSGAPKPFPQRVVDFDVERFASMVSSTGAGYVIFVTTWADFLYPAPCEAIDAVLPGRTSPRDLIADLAQVLESRGIALLLYYQSSAGDKEWWTRMGFERDVAGFHDTWCRIVGEIGERYRRRLAGWFFDEGMMQYPLSAPFERLTRIAKVGNPDRLVTWNAWIFPKVTEFQDFHCGEDENWMTDASCLRHLPRGGGGVYSGGPQEGLQAHTNFCLETQWQWCHTKADTEIEQPRFPRDKFLAMTTDAIARRMAPTINLEVHEDGSASSASLELVHALREAVGR